MQWSYMATATDIRRGGVLRYQEEPHVVLDLIQATLRNLRSGSSSVVKFSSSETVYFCDTENQKLEFSYTDDQGLHFLDPNTFEDIVISAAVVGDDHYYLVTGNTYDIRFIDGKPVTINLPGSVELTVTEAPEVVRGDTATSVLKTVMTDTGLGVKTPAFVKTGDRIKVSTDDGSYISRA